MAADTEKTPGISAEEAHARSLMTPEELDIMDSGLGDDEDSAEDRDDGDEDEIVIVDHKKAKADEKEEDGDEDDEADDEEPAEDDETKDAAGADDGSGDGTEDPSDAPAPKPTYVLPEDHQARREALDIRFAELETKFDEGDIQRAEYAAENRKLMREQADLDREQMRADTALDAYQARVSAMWKDAFDKHMAWAATAEGGGVKYGPSESLRVLLGAEADKIAGANPNLAPAVVWRQADAAVRESLGLNMPAPGQAAVKPTVDDAAAKQAKADKAKARTQDKSQVPQNLGGVTGESAESDVSGNEFAYLDKLQGEAFEAAFAKLSPAKREAYMAME